LWSGIEASPVIYGKNLGHSALFPRPASREVSRPRSQRTVPQTDPSPYMNPAEPMHGG